MLGHLVRGFGTIAFRLVVQELPEAEQGPRIFGRLGLSEGDSVPEARMNEIATRMRDLLLQEPQSRS